jgi:transposase-like protein
MDCPARGQSGKGNISGHSRKERRFICPQCGKTFAERTGTPFYRLRTPTETVTLVVTLLAHGCPLQAIVAAFGFDERTVADWRDRASVHCHAVHAHLIETPRRLGQVQADELRVKMQSAIVWMAMAVMGTTRLWLGGEVRPHRDLSLIRRLMQRVRRCALAGRILICTEGLCSYGRATREAFHDHVATGRRGRQPLRVWGQRLIAQVVKRYENRRVVEVERRVVHGRADQAEKARQASSGEGVINTADIESLNQDVSRALGEFGTSHARSGPHGHTPGGRHVVDRCSLQRLHAAREPWRDGGKGHARAHTGDGDRDHASVLECL